MNYIKKLCILKQVASGFAADGREVSALLTAESLGGRLTLTLAPIGFAPLAAGRYRCVVQDADGRREAFDLPVPSGACVRRAGGLDIARGIGCAVCFVGGKATCVAFGKTGEGAYDPKAMCAAEGEAPTRARQAPPAIPTPPRAGDPTRAADPTQPTPPTTQAQTPPTTQAQTPPPDPPYDDEMLATENYFEKEGGAPSGEACAEKTGAAPAEETGGAQAADGLCSGGPCADDGAPTGGGTGEGKAAEGGGQEKGAESGARDGNAQARAVTGENAQTLFRLHGGENAEPCYYDRVRADLDALFARHPAERELADCIPYSRWARVSFARNKYYAVGVICDEKKPQYICYGVPAEAHGEPPAALKGFCSFLPLSVFEPEGRGYWMMFQDAETGRCVRIERK